ncbi:CBS domain-containing protein [Plesiomonas shigelloides]|uniref:CBS domain-containing protein n=1 Tax=Plesiomonas shigelloides TaxID=703 RepID=A0A8I1WCD7_PLESH|nr:DUF294 nucleotidyltransferase-like domain-containing protein [Plesiomonas shigelloides]MBO1109774.1 CBS domain-containing protein [Plesiomonas shigelloides]
MTDILNLARPPFDVLSPAQQQILQQHVDLTYFRAGDEITRSDRPLDAQSLYVILKGRVAEYSTAHSEPHNDYTGEDIFAAFIRPDPHTLTRFQAEEDTICFTLPYRIFQQLCSDNPDFSHYFTAMLTARSPDHDPALPPSMAEFILQPIQPAMLSEVLTVDEQQTLQAVSQLMFARKTDCALRQHQGQWYILTRTTLLQALTQENRQLTDPIALLPRPTLQKVELGDSLFNAMQRMMRHNIKRIVVVDEQQQPCGILHLTQILSLFSTHTHALALRIRRARTLEELILISAQLPMLLNTLHHNDVHIRVLCQLISGLNELLIEKTFALTIPETIQTQVCLFVLGSEGRREQLLKTDQDNALVIADDLNWPTQQADLARFTTALCQLGYPPCPGHVMVSNPQWVKTVSAWQQAIQQAAARGQADDLLWLAILCDMQAIAGEATLLTPVQQTLHEQFRTYPLLPAGLCRTALMFEPPLNLFGQLRTSEQGVDLKRRGLFPLMHGVRVLAAEAGLESHNTLERLQALTSLGVLSADFADDIAAAFRLLLRLRLHAQLHAASPSSAEQSTELASAHTATSLSAALQPAQLRHRERDLLRHAFQVVHLFQQWLARRYAIQV